MKRAEFRGRHYDVSIDVQADRLLTVAVQDSLTRDCWSGKYDVTYIEELSHKTGNFKQFSIFCSMLESSLVKGTKSVSLDLLTYDDLNALRQQKSEKAHNNNKRYLIMTYTVEFDQIHYPLPLTYSGRQSSPSRRSPSKRSSESELVTENKALKRELRQCYEKLDNIENEDQDAVKEISMLKKVVQNLENELAKEKTKHQRIMNKKKNEYQELLEEFEELKANERNFRVRCKSLTEELAIIKRNSRLSPCTKKATNRKNSTLLSNTTSNQTRRSVSRDNNNRIGRSGVRTSSGDRSSIGRRTPSPGYARFDPSAYIREREEKRGNSLNNSSSRKITPISSKRRVTPVSSSRRVTPISSSNRRVTPVSSSNRRVTPVSKRHSSYSSKPPSSRRSGKTRGYISATSDNDSLPRSSRRERRSNFSDSGSERKPPKSRVTSKSPLHRKKSPLHRKKSRSEDEEEEESGNHSLGIAEIDARLEALQRFMRDNMD